jgi:hypothetical protein
VRRLAAGVELGQRVPDRGGLGVEEALGVDGSSPRFGCAEILRFPQRRRPAMPFLPRDFVVPARVATPRFTRRSITIRDAFEDDDAVMTCVCVEPPHDRVALNGARTDVAGR